MLKSRLIPGLHVKEGRVVKGVNFIDLRDAGDPVECAKAYDAAGADELCFLNITASHENRGIMLDVVQRTAEAWRTFLPTAARTTRIVEGTGLVEAARVFADLAGGRAKPSDGHVIRL